VKFCNHCGAKLAIETEVPPGLPKPGPYQGPAYMQVVPQQRTEGIVMIIAIIAATVTH